MAARVADRKPKTRQHGFERRERLLRPRRIRRGALEIKHAQVDLGPLRERAEKIALVRRRHHRDERRRFPHVRRTGRGGSGGPGGMRGMGRERRRSLRAWPISARTMNVLTMIATAVGSSAVVKTKRLRIVITAAKNPDAYTRCPISELRGEASDPHQPMNAPRQSAMTNTTTDPPDMYASPAKLAETVRPSTFNASSIDMVSPVGFSGPDSPR